MHASFQFELKDLSTRTLSWKRHNSLQGSFPSEFVDINHFSTLVTAALNPNSTENRKESTSTVEKSSLLDKNRDDDNEDSQEMFAVNV